MNVKGKLLIDLETSFSDMESDLETVKELAREDLEDNGFIVHDIEAIEENRKEKIYISGKITGTDDYMERFAATEKALTDKGYSVINPAKTNATLPQETAYGEYMKVSLVLLSFCDCIYLLDGWQDSKGARLEYAYAVEMGKRILREKED